MKDAVFHNLLTQLYRCPGAGSAWTGLARQMRESFQAQHVHFVLFNSDGTVQIDASDHPDAGHEYTRDYAQRDLAVPRVMAAAPGKAFWSHALLTPDELARCPVQNDLLPRFDVGSRTWVQSPFGDGTVLTTSILHGMSRDGLDPRHKLRLQNFHDHVQQALHLHLTIEAARHRQQSFEAGLEVVETGIILLDRNGVSLFANRAARLLFQVGRLRMSDGRIGVAHSASDAALRRMIASALPYAGPAVASAINLPGLRIRAIPIGEPGSAFDNSAAAILLFQNTTAPSLDAARLLSIGLSPAEASLAVALAAGETLEGYATRSRRSLGTIRSQLRSIFSKTDTHRQSELILLVLRTAQRA